VTDPDGCTTIHASPRAIADGWSGAEPGGNGKTASDVEFQYGPQNKPAIHSDSSGAPIHFNLSHSHGLAVYAFGQRREVGIDLEMIQPPFADEEITERFFSSQELAELRELPRAALDTARRFPDSAWSTYPDAGA
jgi:hypothetical protein